MLRDILTLSALILAVFLVRAAFKNRVPKRLLYALWLVVLLKLCLPGTAYALPLLPAEQTAAVQQTETPAQSAPAAQQLDQLAVIAHFGQILPGVGVVDNGAAGDIDYDVLAVAAATAVLGAALAVAGKYMASEFER